MKIVPTGWKTGSIAQIFRTIFFLLLDFKPQKGLLPVNNKHSVSAAFLALLFLGSAELSAQQCDVQAFASSIDILCGDTVKLNGIGSGEVIFENDFDGCNSGPDGTWEFAQNARYDNPCGVTENGTCYLWFGDGSPAPRILETKPLALVTGGTICWDMRYATQGGASPCEGPDLPDEGVTLQYSIDNGATWNDVPGAYYSPNGGNDPYRTSWNRYCEPVPADATASTKIRWIQLAASGAGNDHWGIEDIEIIRNPPNSFYVWQDLGTPQPTGVHTPDVTPTVTTTYTVEYNVEQPDGSWCVATDDVTINVEKQTLNILQDPIGPLCPGDTTSLIAITSVNPPIPACGPSLTGCLGNTATVPLGEDNITDNGYYVIGGPAGGGISFCNTSNGNATGNYTVASRTQFIIRQSELPAYFPGGQIYNLQLLADGAQSLPNMRIKIGCVGKDNFAGSSSGDFEGGLTEVYRGNTNFANGWNTVDFDTHYDYDGTSNIVIEICTYGGTITGDLQKTDAGFNAVVNTATCTNGAACGFYNGNDNTVDNMRPSCRLGVCYRLPPNLQFTWTPATDIDDASNDSVKVYPSGSTTYSVTVMDVNVNPACAVSESVNIEIAPLGDFTPTYNDPLCVGDDLELYGNIAGMTLYEWRDPANNVIGNTEDVTINGVTAGDAGTYTLYVENGNCNNTVTLDVVITANGNPGVPQDSTLCQSEGPVDLFGLITGEDAGGTWVDDTPSGALSGGTFNPAGLDPTTLPATFSFTYELNLCGFTSSTVQVTVNPNPDAPVVDSPITYCLDEIATPLTATGSNLIWYEDAGLGTVNANQPPTPNTNIIGEPAETHYVTQTVAGCESEAAEIDIDVMGSPTWTLVDLECNGTGNQYRVIATIADGDASTYVVDEGAGFNPQAGANFTSGWINSGSAYQLIVSDGFDCLPDTLAGTHTCECLTDVGAMMNEMDTIHLCMDEDYSFAADHDQTTFFLDPNDAKEFIMHDNAGTLDDLIITRNGTGDFTYDENIITKDQVYWVSIVAGNDIDGDGEVDLNDPCLDVTLAKPIVWHDIPVATISGDLAVCNGDEAQVIIDAEEIAPYVIMFTDPYGERDTLINGNQMVLNYPNILDDISVQVSNIRNLHNCATALNLEANLTHTDPVVVVLDSMVCNPDGSSFIAYIAISGGDEPYSYTSTSGHSGSFNAGTGQFISASIPSETTFDFTFSDANGAPCNNGDLTISDFKKCNCITQIGNLSSTAGTPLELCVGDLSTAAVYDQTGEFFDPDDARAFYLHTKSNITDPANVVLDGPAAASTGFQFIPGQTDYGVTYYISALVGNAQGAGVSFSDLCLQRSTIPVQFMRSPDVVMDIPSPVCLEDGIVVNLTFSGPGPFNVQGTADIEGNYTSDASVPVVAPDTGTFVFNITSIDNGQCSRVKSTAQSVTVQQTPAIDTSLVETFICNSTNTGYQVQFHILGKMGGNYTVLGTDGSGASIGGSVDNGVNPPLFVSDEIVNGESFTFSVTDDAIACAPETFAGIHSCPCETEVGSLVAINEPQPFCGLEQFSVNYDPTGQNLDGDDAVNFIFSTSPNITGVLLQNETGSFDVSGLITGGSVVYNQTYYILAVAGNATNGVVDLNALCLPASNVLNIEFYPSPSATISPTVPVICLNQSYNVIVDFNGTVGALFSAWVSDQSGPVVSGTNLADSTTLNLTPPTAGNFTYVLDSILDQTSGCVARDINIDLFGDAPVQVNPSPSAVISGDQDFCFDDAGNTGVLNIANFSGDAPFNVFYSDNLGNNYTFSSSGQDSSFNVALAQNPLLLSTTIFQVDSIQDQSPQQCLGLGGPERVTYNVQPIPDLDLTIDDNILCDGSSTRLTGINSIGTNGIFSTVNGPPGFSSTDNQGEGVNLDFGTITPPVGNYVYTINRITDNSPLGCVNTDSVYTVNLEVIPLPTVRVYTNQAQVCHGDSLEVFFEVTGWSNPGTTVTFDCYSNGIQGEPDSTLTYPAGTTNSFWVTFSNPSNAVITQVIEVANIVDNSPVTCPGTALSTAPVTINPIPVVNMTIDDIALCLGEATDLRFNGFGNGPMTVDWTDGINTFTDMVSVGTESVVAVNPTDSRTYTITQITDASNPACTNSGPHPDINLTIRPLPVGVIAGGGEICSGETYALQAEMQGNGPFDIEVMDLQGNVQGTFNNLLVGSNNISFFPSMTLSYYISTITDVYGCMNSGLDTVSIVVNPTPVPAFTASQLDSCPSFGVQFTNTSHPQFIGNGAEVLWDFGNGETSTAIQPEMTYYTDVAGFLYSISLTVTSPQGCVGRLDSIHMIEAFAMPEAQFSYLPAQPDVTNPTVLFVNESEGATIYNWNIADTALSSLFTTNEFSPWYNFDPVEQDYLVCLEAITENLCRDTTCKLVQVKDVLLINVPNTFTPNDDGDNDFFKAVVSGYSEDENGFELQIFDRWGKIIFEANHPDIPWDGTFKGTIVQNGLYPYRIVVQSKNTTEKEVIMGHVQVLK